MSEEEKLEELQKKVLEWNQKAKIIQAKFNFVLPNYIIDEIIEKESHKNYSNLHCLINCAVVSGRLSKDNGLIIKQVYC